MYRHDPQLTGRSDATGPVNGIIVDTLRITSRGEYNCGITVDSDSTMYVGVSFDTLDLFALNYHGSVKWSKRLISGGGAEVFNSPTIGSNDLLYHTTQAGVFAIDQNGSVVRKYIPASVAYGLVTQIGKDGTVYVISQGGVLQALSPQLELLWSITDPQILWGSIITPSFSPDGKTMYMQRISDANFAAVDLESHTIKWKFGHTGTMNAPVVDAQGNIYIFAQEGSQSVPVSIDTFYSVTPEGSIRWSYEVRNQRAVGGFLNLDPTIDNAGNLYFGADTIYSVTHGGALRWKFPLENDDSNGCPLVCDANGTVYVGTIKNNIIALSNQGKQIWKIKVNGILGLGYAPTVLQGRLIVPTWNSNKLFVIE